MAKKKRVYDDDDGRTIADMSGVTGQNMFIPRRPVRDESSKSGSSSASQQEAQEESREKERPWESQESFTKEERRWFVLGALKAALLIGLVFILGLGLAILLMIWIWG